MKKLDIKKVAEFVEKNIVIFHERRLKKLGSLELQKNLLRKNPYLFKAKNILTAQDLIKNLLDAFLQSQEEEMFGEFLEDLAIFICNVVFNAKKSDLVGIDMEFEKDNNYYIVEIKSGWNWGNSSQIKKLRDNFKNAKTILSKKINKPVIAINGCCYGRDNKPDKNGYFKLCGQRFWEFISGNEELYTQIIEPIGHKAKERNEEFLISYSILINKFTLEFSKMFCDNGKINWQKLVKFNSSINK